MLLRNRDFLILWSGRVVSTLGSSITSIALPLLILALTNSSAQAGFLSAFGWIPYVALTLPVGAMIDRWNRKRIMIICDVIRFVALGSIPLAYLLFHLVAVGQLYAITLIASAAAVFFNIASLASLPRVVPPEDLPQANALNSLVTGLASSVGPAIGGFVISLANSTVVGAALAISIDSVSYLASIVTLPFIRQPFQAERVASTSSLGKDIVAGLRFLWTQPRLRTLALLTMSVNFFEAPGVLIIIVLARNGLHVDSRTIGAILSLGSFGLIIGSLLAPLAKRRLRTEVIVIGSLLIQAATLVLLAFAQNPLGLAIPACVNLITWPLFGVTVDSYRLASTPDALQGRVTSVYQLFITGSQPLGLACAGILLAPVGPRLLLGMMALGVALSTSLLSVFLSR